MDTELGRFLRKTFYLQLLLCALIGLIYLAAVRPWHMRWGTTDAEYLMPLPVDQTMKPGAVVSTRAITIHAAPAAVWPWIAQLGQQHGGFYSYDWIENLLAAKMHNANQIVPAWQNIQVGDQLSFMQNGPQALVTAVEPRRSLTLGGEWMWLLEPVDQTTTRLIIRYAYDVGSDPLDIFYYYTMFEPIHFVMESGMMMGIKQRAES